ncbi:MAG: hypothetical protein EA364_00140, partial [Balneolaceae bacterium]
TAFVAPARIAATLTTALKPDHLIVFSTRENGGALVDQNYGQSGEVFTSTDEQVSGLIPTEIKASKMGYLITGLRQFASLPDVSGMLKVTN